MPSALETRARSGTRVSRSIVIWTALAALSLVGAGVGVGVSVSEARTGARAASCTASHSKTILMDASVRLFSVGAFNPDAQIDTRRIVACLRATGRRVTIGERYTDNYVLWGTVDHLLLTGSSVASLQSQTDASCKAACPPGYQSTVTWVQVNDVRARKHRMTYIQGSLLSRKLRMTPSGVVAWLDGAAGAARLNTLSTRGATVVDEGNIDPASVTLAGSTLSWTKDGLAHTATVA